jgi:hypothetical protein
MPEENMEIIRRLNALFNEAPHDAESWLSYYDPGAEFVAPREWPERRVYSGHAGIEELANAWVASFDEYRWDEEKVLDTGECVVALWHHRGRLGSEWAEREIGSVWYLTGGQIVRVLLFFSWAEALEAAGLEE